MKMLLGNKKSIDRLGKVVQTGTFTHAYLFVGPENVGKTTAAKKFAQALICEEDHKPCGNCPNCLLTQAGNHPDLLFFDGKETIGVDEIRELIHFLDLKPYQAKRKVAVISHVERLTDQASNSLLKTLEEPVQNTIIIQTAEKSQNLLDTIVSRSQAVNFTQISDSEIVRIFETFDLSESDRNFIIKLSCGRPGIALELAESEEKREKTKKLVGTFDKVYFEGKIYEKMNFAAELASQKEDVSRNLDILESHFRSQLISDHENRLKITGLLDKLTETKDLINKNINLQLALESLLLSGEK